MSYTPVALRSSTALGGCASKTSSDVRSLSNRFWLQGSGAVLKWPWASQLGLELGPASVTKKFQRQPVEGKRGYVALRWHYASHNPCLYTSPDEDSEADGRLSRLSPLG
jgi:hypothetical protein